MTLQELRMDPATPGKELHAMTDALAMVEPGDLVVYYQGGNGTAPTSLKRAAAQLMDGGACLLVQRITKERDAEGKRIVDYIAVKAGPMKECGR